MSFSRLPFFFAAALLPLCLACGSGASVIDLGGGDPFTGTDPNVFSGRPPKPTGGGSSPVGNNPNDQEGGMDPNMVMDPADPNVDAGATHPGGGNGGGNTVLTPPASPIVLPMVLTQHNDPQRTGANLVESRLTRDAVSSPNFQKLGTLTVDGDVYAQPLYVSQVAIGGGNHNVLLVATAHNSVYAFDADAEPASPPLWMRNVGTAIPMADFPGETNFATEMGIIGTPVIDLAEKSVYFVAALKVANTADPNANYAHQLYKVSLIDGTDLAGSPVAIEASAPGTGFGANNSNVVALSHKTNLQRTALLLANNRVYFGFGAHGTTSEYHGWFLAYNASTLALNGSFVSSPNSAKSGIWQGGQGAAADGAGAVYVTTGNSLGGNATTERIQSLCKFNQSGTSMTLTDYHTASNWAALDANELDFGSTGALLLPGLSLAISGDQAGNLNFANTANLGQLGVDDSALKQKVNMGPGTAFFSAPVYYHAQAGQRIYAWSQNDVLKAWSVGGATLPATPVEQAASTGQVDMPGGILSVSANGSQARSAVVWATTALNGPASGTVQDGVLYAYDADDLSQLLFSSQTNAARDAPGKFAKFNPPTVAAGKVFVGTFSSKVVVYGLK